MLRQLDGLLSGTEFGTGGSASFAVRRPQQKKPRTDAGAFLTTRTHHKRRAPCGYHAPPPSAMHNAGGIAIPDTTAAHPTRMIRPPAHGLLRGVSSGQTSHRRSPSAVFIRAALRTRHVLSVPRWPRPRSHRRTCILPVQHPARQATKRANVAALSTTSRRRYLTLSARPPRIPPERAV